MSRDPCVCRFLLALPRPVLTPRPPVLAHRRLSPWAAASRSAGCAGAPGEAPEGIGSGWEKGAAPGRSPKLRPEPHSRSCPGLWPLCAVTPRGLWSLQPASAGGFLLLLISRLSLTLPCAPAAMSLMPAPFHLEVSDFSVPSEPSEW